MSTNSLIVVVVAVLILLLALLMVALFIRVLQRSLNRSANSPSTSSPSSSKNVKIIDKGRSGSVQYFEKGKTCEFYWEFGGGDTIAIISFPAEKKWEVTYPWASGRRKEILTFVAEEIRRTQFPSSSIVWEDKCFRLVKA